MFNFLRAWLMCRICGFDTATSKHTLLPSLVFLSLFMYAGYMHIHLEVFKGVVGDEGSCASGSIFVINVFKQGHE